MGGSSAYAYRTSIAVDNNNNLYVTDNFVGTVNLNDTSLIANGNIDFYLSKYDPNGKFLWARQYFDVFNIQSHALTIDENNNLYITGWFTGVATFGDIILSTYGIYDNRDIFIAKIKENTAQITQVYDDPTISIFPNPNNGILYLKAKELTPGLIHVM